jgi:hypothetical protein
MCTRCHSDMFSNHRWFEVLIFVTCIFMSIVQGSVFLYINISKYIAALYALSSAVDVCVRLEELVMSCIKSIS